MRALAPALVLLLLMPSAAALLLEEPADDWSRLSKRGHYRVLEPTVHVLESEIDGAAVTVGVVRPQTPPHVKVPILVRASPYLPVLTPESIKVDYEYSMRVQFVPHGYAVAYVPVRGTAGNGGCMEAGSHAERADLSQAVSWLAAQPWSNGKVGVIGLSYDGYAAWQLAASGNPHVRTIVPMSGIQDPWGWSLANGTLGVAGLVDNHGALYWAGFGVLNLGQAAPRPPERLAGSLDCEAVRASVPTTLRAWQDSSRDAWWDERDQRADALANYTGSIFFVQGLWDPNVQPGITVPLAWAFEEKGARMKWMLGQWAHDFPDVSPDAPSAPAHDHARADWADVLLRWLDRELREPQGRRPVDVGPRVEVQDSSGAWRAEPAWPPADARTQRLHLTSDGRLGGPDTPAADVLVAQTLEPTYFATDVMTEQPGLLLGACALCRAFVSDPFVEDTLVLGAPRAHVTIVPHAPRGTLGAWLFLEHADGTLQRASLGSTMDVRYHAGGESPGEAEPGVPVVARLWIEPMEIRAPAGSRLVLAMSAGGWWGPDQPIPYTLRVGGDASVLEFESVPAAGRAYFTPPRR